MLKLISMGPATPAPYSDPRQAQTAELSGTYIFLLLMPLSWTSLHKISRDCGPLGYSSLQNEGGIRRNESREATVAICVVTGKSTSAGLSVQYSNESWHTQ
jgi:hypothetical protein